MIRAGKDTHNGLIIVSTRNSSSASAAPTEPTKGGCDLHRRTPSAARLCYKVWNHHFFSIPTKTRKSFTRIGMALDMHALYPAWKGSSVTNDLSLLLVTFGRFGCMFSG